jgi:hypothetical protein
MSGQPRCHRCGETVGVYEPMVALVEDVACVSSRAAQPQLSDIATRCYHRACYDSDLEVQHEPLVESALPT